MVYKIPTEGIVAGAVDASLISTDVNNALVPLKGIIMYYGALNAIPPNWNICDGQNGTPDLRDKFVIASGTYDVGNTEWTSAVDGSDKKTGGEATKLLGTANLPSHTHTDGSLSATGGDHQHNTSVTGTKLFTAAGGTTYSYGGAGTYPGTVFTMDDSGDLTMDVTGNTGDQGGTMGESFDIIPPFFALAYIMRNS